MAEKALIFCILVYSKHAQVRNRNSKIITVNLFLLISVASVFGQFANTVHRDLGTPAMVFYKDKLTQPTVENWRNIVAKLGNYSQKSTWQVYNVLDDDLGEKHHRIRHYFAGIPVNLSMGIVHEKAGLIKMVNGDFVPESRLYGVAKIDKKSARDIALKLFPAKRYYWEDEGNNEQLRLVTGVKDTTYFPIGHLEYCPKNMQLSSDFRLCYRFDVFASDSLFGKSIYIDAESGELVATNELICHIDVKGTAVTKFSGTRTIDVDSLAPSSFRLREGFRGKGIETYNMKTGTVYGSAVDFTDNDNYWNNVNAAKDEVATDAHWGAERTYDYFMDEHSRNSFDNNGAKIYSFVHYGVSYDNAFWNGSVMTYGDGSGGTFKEPLTALDVCGHEIAHAVTTYTANLTYSYESGALNEGFSDIFGQSIEEWSRPTQYNWKIGEDITAGAGIRNMANPNAFNHPKYYKGNFWYAGPLDNGGVHWNSGVINYWYYLLSVGGVGTNEKGDNYNIAPQGITDAGKIAYRTLSVYLTASSQYADARTYSIISAADLFGHCSDAVIATTNAWWVCGVGAKYDSGYVKAAFAGDTHACKIGMNLNFMNLSENFKSSKWYFGDGGTSTSTNPTRSYSTYGKFTVSLVVQSCFKNNKDSLAKVLYVKIDSTYDICNAFLLPTSSLLDSAIGCKGFVYDDGGEGNYGLNAIKEFQLKLPGADSIRFRFKVLDYELNYDSLVVFRNSVSQANKIGRFTGNVLPNSGNWYAVKADRLIFKQYSDPMLSGKGFKVEYKGIFKPLQVALGNDTSLCYGFPVTLKAAATGGRLGTYKYRWTGKGVVGDTARQLLVLPDSLRKYSVFVDDGCNAVSNTDNQWLRIKPKLTAKILPADTQVCVGKKAVLRIKYAGGDTLGYKFYWNGVLGVDTLLVDFPQADTLKYRIRLDDGCSASDAQDSTTIMTYQAIGIEKSNDTTICYGTSVSIVGNVVGGDRVHGGPGFYTRWSTGEFTAGITVNPKVTTTYYVWGGEGCSLEGADSVKVTVLPKLYISNVLDSILCYGQTYTVNLRDTGGLNASRKIFWSDPAITGNSVVLNPDTGLTNYRVWVEDGCSIPNDTSEFSIYRHPKLLGDLVLDKDTLCFGDSAQISVSFSGGKPSTRSWSINGISPAITVFKVAPSVDTPLKFEVKDGCSADVLKLDTIVVSGKKITHKVVASDTLICYYETNGFIRVSVSGGRAPFTHRWNDVLSTTDTAISNLGIGNYTLVSRDLFGCTDSIRVTVTHEGDVLSARSDTIIYRGGRVKLWMNDGMKWKWMPAVAAEGTDTNRFYFVRPVKSQQYTVTALDSAGCLWRDTVFVTVVDPPLVRIPNVITPNNDGENDVWDLIEVPNLEQFDIEIYDRPGALVYRTSNYLNDWKAEDSSGKKLLPGIYFYYMRNRVSELEYRGFVQVIRE